MGLPFVCSGGDRQIDGLASLAWLARGTCLKTSPIGSGEARIRAVEDTKARHLPACTLRRILSKPRLSEANIYYTAARGLLVTDLRHR